MRRIATGATMSDYPPSSLHGAEAAVIYVAGAEQRLVSRARQLQDSTSLSSWELADIYVALKGKHGWTQARIAEECGTGQSSVSRFIACAKKYALVHNRPPFWEAFQEVVGKVGARGVASESGTDDPPFHILVASGEFRESVESKVRSLLREWPEAQHGVVPDLLRSIADELEGEIRARRG